MALRNQPYIPLYVQDFLTDEKLMECSAASTGVYIRIMCIMHKSDEYGTILLKQKDKQSTNQINNFALKLAKFMPYNLSIITDSLNELLDEKVLSIDGDKLIQKRMVKDGDVSDKRASAGSKGGTISLGKKEIKPKKFAQAKSKANSEYENEYENDIAIKNKNETKDQKLEKKSIEVLNYLNQQANRKFRVNVKSNLSNIKARLSDGNDIQTLFDIIDMKCYEWLNDAKMCEYLQPDTLFNATKFEKYLEQLTRAKSNPEQFKNNADVRKQQSKPADGISEMQRYKQDLLNGIYRE